MRAIESVLSQTHDNCEIIVVDDASDDDTSEVIEVYRQRLKNLKHIRNVKRLGGAESRNIGVRKACGQYIAFLDDDDEWLPQKTEKQVQILEDNPEVGAVSCWYNKIRGGSVRKVMLVPSVSFDIMLWENFIGSFSFCMVRSNIAKMVKLDSELPSSQDWQFWIELSRITQISILEDYLVNYYDHPGEKVSNSYSSKFLGLRKMYFKYRNNMSKNCRMYRLTYLIIYKIFYNKSTNKNFIGLAIHIFKKSFLLKNKISRFALKKTLLSRIYRTLHLNIHDSAWLTYRFIKKLGEHNNV